MDLSFRAIHDIVHPTAAFSRRRSGSSSSNNDDDRASSSASSYEYSEEEEEDGTTGTDGDEVDWARSQLNPRNRIDSLAPMARPLWRIDGSAGFGTQFYAYPLFLDGPPPMHIDVFVHEGASYPRVLRKLLDLDVSFHVKDAQRVRRLGIAQHILRILQWHTNDGSLHPDAVKDLYRKGPFGSRIIIEGLSCHIRETRVVVSPNYPLENDLMSYQELVGMWGLDEKAKSSLPPEVSVDKVHLVRQLHDSISEVYVDGEAGGNLDGACDESRIVVVLKSLTSGVKYMYQEMRALLKDIPPHRYILSRPLHIVTKQCLFGHKQGVIGFTMPLLKEGSLRDTLPLLRMHGRLHQADQLRWARQITEAMCHVWHRGQSFYPDLRLDNVMLAGPAPDADAGLVDFEQRGVWSSFSAPEVDYIENIRMLAFDDQHSGFAIPEDVCREYKEKLALCYEAAAAVEEARASPKAAEESERILAADKKALFLRLDEETKYSNPPLSYNVSWACLTKREQEAAMVYMLGRLLWCIFEGMSAPHCGAIWQSYPREPDLEFPAFRHASREQQSLVLKCFGAAGAQEHSRLVRWKSKLYMKQQNVEPRPGSPPPPSDPAYKLVSDGLADKARVYWREQVKESEAWLEARNQQLHAEAAARRGGRHDDTTEMGETSAHGRPTLNMVLGWIKELESRASL